MTIRLHCKCGRRLSVKDELAGRKVKCPECGEGVVVPQPETDEVDQIEKDEIEDSAGGQRPRTSKAGSGTKRRKKSSQRTLGGKSTMVWLAAGGGGLLVIVMVVIIVSRNREPKPVEAMPNAAASPIVAGNPGIPVGSSSEPAQAGRPTDALPIAKAPFTAEQARAYQDDWARYIHVDREYTNSVGMKFVLIPPGEFLMGSSPAEVEVAAGGNAQQKKHLLLMESPQHRVILTEPIYLGVHEVTQKQYEQVMGMNPSLSVQTGRSKDETNHPVDRVSWNDASEFCSKLSQLEKLEPFSKRDGETVTPLNGTGYRLPTEAEWEFACRAGTKTQYWIGDQEENLAQAGWFDKNFGRTTHAVAELKANPFGLYDVHGNVDEWVQDFWELNYYGEFQNKPAINPTGHATKGSRQVSMGGSHVIRGGSRDASAGNCRSARRGKNMPVYKGSSLGFRVVRVPSRKV